MPRYLYHCSECSEEYQESHSIKERLTDCRLCNSKDSLVRVPSIFSPTHKNRILKQKSGNIVKEFIEESKEDLKRQKEDLEQSK